MICTDGLCSKTVRVRTLLSRSWLAIFPLGGDGRKAALLAGRCRRHHDLVVGRETPVGSYEDELIELQACMRNAKCGARDFDLFRRALWVIVQ